MAAAYVSKGESQKAIKLCDEALRETKQERERTFFLEKIFKIEPNFTNAENLANNYLSLRAPVGAANVYEKFLINDPTNLEIYKRIARIYLEMGSREGAQSTLEKASKAGVEEDDDFRMIKEQVDLSMVVHHFYRIDEDYDNTFERRIHMTNALERYVTRFSLAQLRWLSESTYANKKLGHIRDREKINLKVISELLNRGETEDARYILNNYTLGEHEDFCEEMIRKQEKEEKAG